MRTLNDEMFRPFYLLRPRVFLDGNSWCALYGVDIQEGICAFGDTPAEAAELFDVAFYEGLRAGKAGPRRTALVPEGEPEAVIKRRQRVGWWAIPLSLHTPEGEPAEGFFLSDERAAKFSTDPGFSPYKKVPCWIDED